jgi:hypothetical protein
MPSCGFNFYAIGIRSISMPSGEIFYEEPSSFCADAFLPSGGFNGEIFSPPEFLGEIFMPSGGFKVEIFLWLLPSGDSMLRFL